MFQRFQRLYRISFGSHSLEDYKCTVLHAHFSLRIPFDEKHYRRALSLNGQLNRLKRRNVNSLQAVDTIRKLCTMIKCKSN